MLDAFYFMSNQVNAGANTVSSKLKAPEKSVNNTLKNFYKNAYRLQRLIPHKKPTVSHGKQPVFHIHNQSMGRVQPNLSSILPHWMPVRVS